jgi:hypothetical protein
MEGSDYSPGPWRGHDFGSARVSYEAHRVRSYETAVTTGRTVSEMVPTNISTNSSCPLVILCDVTGSMDKWPGIIFGKLPYLEHEAKEYLGPDCEISFGAVGDAISDKYSLQVRPFTKALRLKAELEGLVIEGEGGWSSQESYEVAALYYARNCIMQRAVRPTLIYIGDEQPYDWIDPHVAKSIAKVHLTQRVDTASVFEELKRKFSVYIIRKPYSKAASEPQIQLHWATLLGEDHVAPLDEPERVVDVIFGILAQESGRVDDFLVEIQGRQKPHQVAVVNKALTTIHKLAGQVGQAKQPKALPAGRSSLHKGPSGTKSKSLLD